MRFTLQFVLVLLLGTLFAAGITAQDAPVAQPDTAATDTTTTADGAAADATTSPEASVATTNSHEIRERFAEILRNHPRELGTILALDPTLLSNDAFLVGYPTVAAFVAEHPQVRRNPRFYLREYAHRDNSFDQIVEPFAVMGVFALIAFALSWLVRTIIEQKRWNRLSKIQTEVHNKILDRFGTSAELLDYVKTPAGSRFLESAPIPLYADQPSRQQPRVLWSIQAGIVIAAGALGMLLVSARFEAESGQGLFALGMISLSIGIGFVISAAVSIALAKRLTPPTETSERLDLVR